MKKTNKGILNLLSYIALVAIGLLIILQNFLPIIHVIISGGLVNLLETVKNILVLIVIGCTAYNFTSGRKQWVKILFWVAVAIFVVGTILMWI